MVLNNTCECIHTLRKNAYGLVHARLCNGVAAILPWKLLRTYHESCANIVRTVVCHPPSCRLDLGRPPPSPDAVRLRNPSKSTLAHDAVAAAVLHKHHPTIHVNAGLIQFIYGSRSHLVCVSLFFSRRLPVTEMHFRHFRASFLIFIPKHGTTNLKTLTAKWSWYRRGCGYRRSSILDFLEQRVGSELLTLCSRSLRKYSSRKFRMEEQ